MVCTLHQILLEWSNQAKWDKLGLWYVEGEEKWIQGLFGKPEGKRPLWRSTHRWDKNTKIKLEDKEWKKVDFIQLAQNTDW
jgi:hypothetical protein